MRASANLHTTQSLGDHGREIEIALDVSLNTTLLELLQGLKTMGNIRNDYITLRYVVTKDETS